MSDAVLFEVLPTADRKNIGIATLNSERTLNSLSVEMVSLLRPQLEAWQLDTSIVCVILQGAGEKAFCAGGDVRRVYDSIIECGADTPNPYAAEFFENEYRLDYLIHQYQKPFIVWGHGFVMGGGIGLMSGASHRVVTEKSRLAMPEMAIGLFPDVGSTWFLTRTPGRTGLFLGLTGAHFNAADALFIGLADRYIAHERKEDVIAGLVAAAWTDCTKTNVGVVSAVLREAENLNELPASTVRQHYDIINQLTDADTLVEIAHNIVSFETEDSWMQRAAAGLNNGCPTTAYIVYEQLRRGNKLSLEAVFQMELVVALQCSKHPDFPEGVRALLVDKDGAPQWQHASIAEVPFDWVEAHFTAPWGKGESNPLDDIGD